MTAPVLVGVTSEVFRRAGTYALDVTVLLVRLASRAARPLVAAALDSLDVTALVREYLDANEFVRDIDVNDVVATVDLDAIIARLDLADLARRMVTAADLTQIVRESSSTLTSEAVRGVRTECARADDAIARLADRVLRRTPTGDPPPP